MKYGIFWFESCKIYQTNRQFIPGQEYIPLCLTPYDTPWHYMTYQTHFGTPLHNLKSLKQSNISSYTIWDVLKPSKPKHNKFSKNIRLYDSGVLFYHEQFQTRVFRTKTRKYIALFGITCRSKYLRYSQIFFLVCPCSRTD